MNDNDVVVAVAFAWVNQDSSSTVNVMATATICERLDLDPDQLVKSGELIEVLTALKATIKFKKLPSISEVCEGDPQTIRWRNIVRRGGHYHQLLRTRAIRRVIRACRVEKPREGG